MPRRERRRGRACGNARGEPRGQLAGRRSIDPVSVSEAQKVGVSSPKGGGSSWGTLVGGIFNRGVLYLSLGNNVVMYLDALTLGFY